MPSNLTTSCLCILKNPAKAHYSQNWTPDQISITTLPSIKHCWRQFHMHHLHSYIIVRISQYEAYFVSRSCFGIQTSPPSNPRSTVFPRQIPTSLSTLQRLAQYPTASAPSTSHKQHLLDMSSEAPCKLYLWVNSPSSPAFSLSPESFTRQQDQ